MMNELVNNIGKGVPGTVVLIANILKEAHPNEKVDQFFVNILRNRIFGSRLYYIWKEVCNKNNIELLEHNFDQYNDAYFYEAYEKYFE